MRDRLEGHLSVRHQTLELADSATKSDGTQAIRRAASILKYVAGRPTNGATLREISEAIQLSRSTAHRILKCLVHEQLLAQSDDAKRYAMGDLTLELGLAAKTLQKAILDWRAVVEDLARDTGVTVYLVGRSGNELVILDAVHGSSVVRVIPVEVGQRRPLGLGAGATALLASMSEEECEQTVASIEQHLHRHSSVKAGTIRENVRRARETGFAESLGVVAEGISASASPFRRGAARRCLRSVSQRTPRW